MTRTKNNVAKVANTATAEITTTDNNVAIVVESTTTIDTATTESTTPTTDTETAPEQSDIVKAQAAQARAKAASKTDKDQAKQAAAKARAAAVESITAATEKTARQAASLSAIVSAAISVAKTAAVGDPVRLLISDMLTLGGGALDTTDTEPTKAERAAYIRALRMVYPYVAAQTEEQTKAGAPAVLLTAVKVGVYLTADGKQAAAYTFAPIDRWSAAKVVRTPLRTLLRKQAQAALDMGGYYTDSKGSKVIQHTAAADAAISAYAAYIDAKGAADKAKAEREQAQAVAFSAAQAQAKAATGADKQARAKADKAAEKAASAATKAAAIAERLIKAQAAAKALAQDMGGKVR